MNSKYSILFFLFSSLSIFASRGFNLISSDANAIIIDYRPSYTVFAKVNINNQEYFRIELLNGVMDERSAAGLPAIPVELVNIGVPSEHGNIIEILDSEFKLIEGKILPIPDYRDNDNPELLVKESVAYGIVNEDNPVSFGEFGISRNIQVQTLKLSPVYFDAVTNTIKKYERIRFKVTYSKSRNGLIQVKEKKLAGSLLNFSEASDWGIDQQKLKKAANSSLFNGIWYKFAAVNEGIYRIPLSQLGSLGISASTVDPRTIKIFNNGGLNLPENPETQIENMVEIPIQVVGEEDGSFDSDDYILFYGKGTTFWTYDSIQAAYVRQRHNYSKVNYYFITSGGSPGKRMQIQQSLNSGNPFVQTITTGFAYVDVDTINIGKSGRDYWGDEISSSNRTLTYINSLNGLIPGSEIKYKFRFANSSRPEYSLAVTENDQLIVNRVIYGTGSALYKWGSSTVFTGSFTGSVPNDRSVVKFNYSSSSSDARGYIDYMEIQFQKSLRAYNDQILFFSERVDAPVEMRLFNFSNSNIRVFDITNSSSVIEVIPRIISGGEATIEVNGTIHQSRKYFAVTSDNFFTVSDISQIENSDIQGTAPGAEYLIITDKKFAAEAERLRNYRANEAPDKLSSVVVFADQIYNEFSTGIVDPTAIRNFLRYAYLNWQIKPFFVLLLGDGTYDYFNTDNASNNFIPTFQTPESLDEIGSYPYDDYYSRIVGNDQKADLAVGRVNVVSVSDAVNYIDKIISYEKDSQKGLWRNRITLVADDGLTSSGNDGDDHTDQSEQLANRIIPPSFDLSKIFLSKYPTVITGLGRRKPAVNQAIIDAVNNGTLLLNFTGHGNPNVWAHENVFERTTSISQFKNDKYFFLTAATCDFGRYDDPESISSTEEMLLLQDRGMIGGFSAARLVYSSPNAAINNSFYSYLMDQTLKPTIGEAFFLVKQRRNDDNDEKFHLFCDPAVKLNRPYTPVSIDKVNNSSLMDTVNIKALSEVKIEGSVTDGSGSVNTAFNGEGIITVFDSEKMVHLDDINYNILEQGGIIFRGRVNVENGRFETSFTVPKDISYENKNGKVVAYLYNETEDGIGFTKNIIVGGTDTTVTDDGEGPFIDVYFDDLTDKNAYLVNPDFNLLVKLADGTGLNTTGTGVGHKLEGIIDNDEENPVDFSNYFIGDKNSGGKSGVIDYQFTDFPVGEHKIKIKAWDVFNNPSSVETYFTVVTSGEFAVKDVYNYPNPFKGNTSFTFQHNLNEMIDVKIKIYTVAGRMIKELESNAVPDKFVKIHWDGRDTDGSELATGTYLYKLIVKATDSGYTKSILGKLAVIH
ncbi:MAG: type IX secretion system sortase PorU [Melioribacteraceae bacterium]|nr:type IX secretion system sortase PorU [Melioribacteraceae bacterium]